MGAGSTPIPHRGHEHYISSKNVFTVIYLRPCVFLSRLEEN